MGTAISWKKGSQVDGLTCKFGHDSKIMIHNVIRKVHVHKQCNNVTKLSFLNKANHYSLYTNFVPRQKLLRISSEHHH